MARQRKTDHRRTPLGLKRLTSILARLNAATRSTLEMKISDAGPFDQRIDPLPLSVARNVMIAEGSLRKIVREEVNWFYLAGTPQSDVEARLATLLPIYKELKAQALTMRMGQALEIAVFKALSKQNTMRFFGSFKDLQAHDDSTLYSKDEPPSTINGHNITGALDFIVTCPNNDLAGIEVKNVREWLYVDRKEIKELFSKCCALDIVPVLIARRIPFVTFKLLHACGAVVHQTYNQRFPHTDHKLAVQAKDKNLFGYHDIRLGNAPDVRLLKFICEDLPRVLPRAREHFDEYKDIVEPFATGEHQYPEFAARVRRRSKGAHEDSDWHRDNDGNK